MTTESRTEINMTRDDVFDALIHRLIELGEDKAAVAERARNMINGWSWFSENSDDGNGHLTCYDWLDSRIAWLLDPNPSRLHRVASVWPTCERRLKPGGKPLREGEYDNER